MCRPLVGDKINSIMRSFSSCQNMKRYNKCITIINLQSLQTFLLVHKLRLHSDFTKAIKKHYFPLILDFGFYFSKQFNKKNYNKSIM